MLTVNAEGHVRASLASLVLLPSWLVGQQPTAISSTQYQSGQSADGRSVEQRKTHYATDLIDRYS